MLRKPSRPADAVAHAASLVDVLTTFLLVGWAATEAHPVIAKLFATVGAAPVVIASPLAVAAVLAAGRYAGRRFDVPARWRELALVPVCLGLTALGVRNLSYLATAGLPETFQWAEFGLVAAATASVAMLVYARAWRYVELRRPSPAAARVAAVSALLVLSMTAPFMTLQGPIQNASAASGGTLIDGFEDGDVAEWDIEQTGLLSASQLNAFEGGYSGQFGDDSTSDYEAAIDLGSPTQPDSVSAAVLAETGTRNAIWLSGAGLNNGDVRANVHVSDSAVEVKTPMKPSRSCSD